MNLLDDPWIPVRSNSGAGAFQLLTYRALLCEPGQNWQISLPRDDLELACLQLLVCLTQVLFLPEDDGSLRARIEQPLDDDAYSTGAAPCLDWFDLDHPTQPFMQTRGVQAAEATPIQKLLIGLPEGNNHAFFNEVGEVRQMSGPLAAIALFNQASNCPSFGGGFKGSLRGGAPITTLVFDTDLRRMVWRNVLTRQRLAERQIEAPGPTIDKPTWIEPITEKSTIHWSQIGLMRGLFWQPAHVELIKADLERPCDVLGGASTAGYSAFRKEKFNFTVQGVWPHPHGALQLAMKKGESEPEKKFASFTTTAPAWTQLSEFVLPRSIHDADAKEGSTPAGPVTQAQQLALEDKMTLLIGGYRTKKAAVLQRRHELIGLAQGWQDDKNRIGSLVDIAMSARGTLLEAVFTTAFGQPKANGLKGNMKGNGLLKKKKGRKKIRSVRDADGFHDLAEESFYARTESLIHSTFSSTATFREWGDRRRAFVEEIAKECRNIFEELTNPYAMKPELIPVIACRVGRSTVI
jgi:CRISPR system Cascade subunit CasA